MLSLQMIHMVQTGLKYFFDIDPSLTEHIYRHAAGHATLLPNAAVSYFRSYSDKFAELLLPVAQDLRSLRFGGPEL